MVAVGADAAVRRRVRVVLPSDGSAGAGARAVVRGFCRAWGLGGSEEEGIAVQCVSELAANVLQHVAWQGVPPGAAAWLCVSLAQGWLRVEVGDPDPRVPRLLFEAQDGGQAAEAGLWEESGRGLRIVRGLVVGAGGVYGAERGGIGKVVFFALPMTWDATTSTSCTYIGQGETPRHQAWLMFPPGSPA
jgi:anti-sigma regulatory factor (Ser/Thr protein kinase)